MESIFTSVPLIGRHVGALLEGFVFLFLCFEVRKPKSPCGTGYFVILTLGYGVDFINNLSFLYALFGGYTPGVLLIQWYMRFFMGFWTFVLGVNRCTALAFPVVYTKLWSKRFLNLICFFVLAFPFIANGYSLFDIHCRLNTLSHECNDYRIAYHYQAGIINTALCLASLVAIAFGVWKIPKSINRTMVFKLEFRLIVQTIIVSVFLSFYFLTYVYATHIYIENHDQYDFLTKVANYFYFLSHYPPIIALFFISPLFRNAFLKFYRIRKRSPCQANPIFHSKVITVTKMDDIV